MNGISKLVLVTVVVLIANVPAQAGEPLSSTGGPAGSYRTVETSMVVAADQSEALRAFLDPAALAGWWKVSRSLVEEKSGGTWAITWDDYGAEKTHHVWSGVIEEIGPDRIRIAHLVMVEPGRPLFAPLTLEILTDPHPQGARVTVLHQGYQEGPDWDWAYDTVVKGWAHVLGDLRDWFAAGRP